jgi:hypothetical protein
VIRSTVRKALAGLETPVYPVLCFVNGENWGRKPKSFRHEGVLVTWAQELAELIGGTGTLEPEQVEAIARQLSERMKPST